MFLLDPVQELTLYHARILMNVRYPLHCVQKVKCAVTLKDPTNVYHPPGQEAHKVCKKISALYYYTFDTMDLRLNRKRSKFVLCDFLEAKSLLSKLQSC